MGWFTSRPTPAQLDARAERLHRERARAERDYRAAPAGSAERGRLAGRISRLKDQAASAGNHASAERARLRREGR